MTRDGVVGGGGFSKTSIKNGSALFGQVDVLQALSNYNPVFFVDIWQGPLPFQGAFLGSVRIPANAKWFARVVKVPPLEPFQPHPGQAPLDVESDRGGGAD